MSLRTIRRRLGASAFGRRVTDSPPVGRVIAACAHGRVVRPSFPYLVRELTNSGRTATYCLRESGLLVRLRHNTTDASILDEVFLQRIYEPPMAVSRRLVGLGRPLRIADLGANIGLFGAFAFGRWPVAHMTAIEPHPDNAVLLALTIDANELKGRWALTEACAAATGGKLPFTFVHFSDSRVSVSSSDHGRGEGAHLQLVESIDVFPLLNEIDLVKIDIEGGEWDLLSDPRLARLSATAIALEYHPHLAPGPDARAEAIGALKRAGYEVQPVSHDPRGHGMLWASRVARPSSEI